MIQVWIDMTPGDKKVRNPIHQNVDSHCTVDQNRSTDEVTRVTNANGHCGAHLLNHIYMVQYDGLLSQHVHIVDG